MADMAEVNITVLAFDKTEAVRVIATNTDHDIPRIVIWAANGDTWVDEFIPAAPLAKRVAHTFDSFPATAFPVTVSVYEVPVAGKDADLHECGPYDRKGHSNVKNPKRTKQRKGGWKVGDDPPIPAPRE